VDIPEVQLQTLRDYTVRMARELKVVGLMNAQYAIQGGKVYVLEVNPRASRTVPYVSKATGVPLAKLAARLMVGRKISEFGLEEELRVHQYFVKSPVFPFQKFPGVDSILGPEMKSTGEVMGVGDTPGLAYAKAQIAAMHPVPSEGQVFISVNDQDKTNIIPIARDLASLGFRLVATSGTASTLRKVGLSVEKVFKVNEGRPNVVDLVRNGTLAFIINTPLGRISHFDEKAIRRAAVKHSVSCVTTLSAAVALVNGIRAQRDKGIQIASLQELHRKGSAVVSRPLSVAKTPE
jgi:carbamoyl-phosphate synthase large subunit